MNKNGDLTKATCLLVLVLETLRSGIAERSCKGWSYFFDNYHVIQRRRSRWTFEEVRKMFEFIQRSLLSLDQISPSSIPESRLQYDYCGDVTSILLKIKDWQCSFEMLESQILPWAESGKLFPNV
jgi:hypothetical protein